jgi:cob(I)alamin adenosyltransferase
MKIYTRSGDKGQTGLFGGERVSKSHIRLHAYGTVDELNAILGIAVAHGLEPGIHQAVVRIQHELFAVGADLATPLDVKTDWITRVSDEMVARLEMEIDEWDGALPPLKNFILPGGSLGGAYLHQARVVCRRAERWVVSLQDAEVGNPAVLRYLNRLSDWLFVAARKENMSDNQPELVWKSPDQGK